MEVKFQLKQRIEQAHRIVFLGGAGVSTASGLPDFRSDQTQHRVQQHYGVSVETLLSYRYFYEQPEQVYDYLNTFLHLSSLKPNAAHRGLVCLEQKGYPLTIITQNIDGLHQAAGSHRVLELHGNLRRFYCSTCEKTYDLTDVVFTHPVPYCPHCQGQPRGQGLIRPDMVFYEEDLDEGVWFEARQAIAQADLLIVAGTSLQVYPAAGLLESFNGKDLVLINTEPTRYDSKATLVIREKVEHVLTDVSQAVKEKEIEETLL